MKYFSKNVKRLRENTGLSQQAFAESIGIIRTTWHNYESGHSNPNLEGLITIAKFFDVTESDLLHTDLTKVYAKPRERNKANLADEDAHTNPSIIIADLRKTIAAMEKIIHFNDYLQADLHKQLKEVQDQNSVLLKQLTSRSESKKNRVPVKHA
jgi:transcriptional regulator with XRE-family HTH domain